MNLFGLRLSVTTIAFQEQDTVVAACATSALWAAFQGTGVLFHHGIPSPVEITRAATAYSDEETRTFPSVGLSAAQMAQAIRSVSLEPYLVQAKDRHALTSAVFGYVAGHIPALLLGELWEVSGRERVGLHAVAVLGYSLGLPASLPLPTGTLLRSSRINKIYAHDDQVGPFARMDVDGDQLRTSWGNGQFVFRNSRLLVPLYNKVRIPFGTIQNAVLSLDVVIEMLRQHLNLFQNRLEWEINITLGNDIKKEALALPLTDDGKMDVVLTHFPRFVWRARALDGTTPVLDLLFDATDIAQGELFLRPIEYHCDLGECLRFVGGRPGFIQFCRDQVARNVLKWYANAP